MPRTGGTSLTELLKPHLGPGDVSDELLEKHQSMEIMQIGFMRNGVFHDYAKFAVVRHPFERFASLHQGYVPKCDINDMVYQLVSGKINFKTYDFYWPIQRWLCGPDGKLLVDVIFKFEDGFKEVVHFLNTLKIPVKFEDFPHVNKGTVNNGDREYYEKQRELCTDETIRGIQSLYAWDYEAFGYK